MPGNNSGLSGQTRAIEPLCRGRLGIFESPTRNYRLRLSCRSGSSACGLVHLQQFSIFFIQSCCVFLTR